jgi:thioredoxin reductase (NADPH)
MEKPIIMAVDDDRVVLNAVQRDMRRQYGQEYRIVGADSGQGALEALRTLKLRSEVVALLVVDQRMPAMTGVEFLGQAIQIFPEAKKVLLTAYADTQAAIRAINDIRLDYYLMKPWDPPEEQLYPVLGELLDDWRAGYRPAFEGIRVVGTRWSPLAHDIKGFLARNQVPYQWLDVEGTAEARRLLEMANADAMRLPVLFFADGVALVQPTRTQVAERVGLRTHAEAPFYDLIIVGSGPAGLAAGVYGASEGLHTLLVEREAPGGQAGESSRIENYLGFPVGLSGADLARRAVAQATRFGAEILTPQEATAVRLKDSYKIVALADGTEVSSHALLVATGVQYRKLDAQGAERLAGAGVYYGAAITEALSTRGGDAYVVGGGNSAGQAAMYLSGFATSVTLLVRGGSLAAGMSHYLIQQLGATPNVRVLVHTTVQEVLGETNLEAITWANSETGEVRTVPAVALFVFIGAAPRTDWLGDAVERDKAGFVLTGAEMGGSTPPRAERPPGSLSTESLRGAWSLARDPYWLETSVPGIFAAGDVRARSVKRIASAVGEGAMAVQFIHQYLATL